ncbi:MAG: lipopolysaccharide biosynthesis protein, partial [Bdellovibrionales bacterium]
LTKDQTKMKIKDEHKNRFMNLSLRMVSLASKLILTLYMGRYFELSALGAYGLVFSAVVVVNTLLGQELGYIVKREIVGSSPQAALIKMRDQFIWHSGNYLIFTLVTTVLLLSGFDYVSPKYIIYILAIGIAESLGSMAYNNMNLLGQQVMANGALFIRAAAWVPFVIALGFWDKSFRTEDTVLTAWAISSTLSLSVPLWTWRNWGWKNMIQAKIDYKWMKQSVKKSAPIWLGSLGLMVGGYIDRFFINHFINIELVGVMTFYYSFINAMPPLIESGALIFSAPKMVEFYKNKKTENFWKEAKNALIQIGIGVALLSLALSIFVPVLGYFMGKPAFLENIHTFWLLLGATWINSISLVLHYVLFAQHRDKPIWTGNILFVIPVITGNMFFVPHFGFIGIGYSAIISALLLILWRGWFIRSHKGF